MYQNDSLACHRCLRDKTLVNLIREEGKRSWCDWCGGRNVYVIPLYMLGDIFRDAVSIYQPGEWDDEPISFLLQEDWGVFSEEIEQAPNDLMQEMTVAILKAGLTPKEYVSDYPAFDESFRRQEPWLVDHWHYRAEAYFERGQTSDDLYGVADNNGEQDYSRLPDELEAAFEDLQTSYEPGKILYRARIHKDRFRSEKFESSELGSPAPEKTPAGRANRKNGPVLYLANDAATALSEVRAWKGTAVAIAEVQVKKTLSIISLLDYRLPQSPFFDDLLEWKIQLAQLFDRLSYEFSLPVIAHEDERLYFSTQYLCDWVRKAGHNGIEYPSAMGNGFNIVLFDPEDAEVLNSKYVRVTNIQHAIHEIDNYDPIYDESPFDYLFDKSDPLGLEKPDALK